MSHKLSKNDPLYYKKALIGLIDEARENGVTVTISDSNIVFDDRKKFYGEEIITTSCSVELEGTNR